MMQSRIPKVKNNSLLQSKVTAKGLVITQTPKQMYKLIQIGTKDRARQERTIASLSRSVDRLTKRNSELELKCKIAWRNTEQTRKDLYSQLRIHMKARKDAQVELDEFKKGVTVQ